MMISLYAYRRLDQRAEVALSWWTVGPGTRYLIRETWDPRGPLGALEAVDFTLQAALGRLRRTYGGQYAPAALELYDVG